MLPSICSATHHQHAAASTGRRPAAAAAAGNAHCSTCQPSRQPLLAPGCAPLNGPSICHTHACTRTHARTPLPPASADMPRSVARASCRARVHPCTCKAGRPACLAKHSTPTSAHMHITPCIHGRHRCAVLLQTCGALAMYSGGRGMHGAEQCRMHTVARHHAAYWGYCRCPGCHPKRMHAGTDCAGAFAAPHFTGLTYTQALLQQVCQTAGKACRPVLKAHVHMCTPGVQLAVRVTHSA